MFLFKSKRNSFFPFLVLVYLCRSVVCDISDTRTDNVDYSGAYDASTADLITDTTILKIATGSSTGVAEVLTKSPSTSTWQDVPYATTSMSTDDPSFYSSAASRISTPSSTLPSLTSSYSKSLEKSTETLTTDKAPTYSAPFETTDSPSSTTDMEDFLDLPSTPRDPPQVSGETEQPPTDLPTSGYTDLTVPTTIGPLPEGFCYINISTKYETGCIECSTEPCQRGGVIIGTETCEDSFECNYQCMYYKKEVGCCYGYFYSNSFCSVCPGGVINPCNGNGKCTNEYPYCQCMPGFAGTACELCQDGRYGEDCSGVCTCVNGTCNSGLNGDGTCNCFSGFKGANCDEKLLKCEDLECIKKNSSHSRCIEVNGSPSCVCDVGYRYNATLTDCVAVNPCENAISPCGKNSICTMVSPGKENCTCEDDYFGDGYVCIPKNPCDLNEGLCGDNTFCLMTGANKYVCTCRRGYRDYKPGVGCSLINVCTPNSCTRNAVCETYEPFIFKCTCKEGYLSRNDKCLGNIYETLVDLNSVGQLRKSFDYAVQYIQRFYNQPLKNHGPFTLFLPTDGAFREATANFGSFEKFMRSEDQARQILRQHIVVGKLRAESMRDFNTIYTLQGRAAKVYFTSSGGIRYRLEGWSSSAKVVRKNFEASNGMIHVISRLLTPRPKILGNPQLSALELIKEEQEYSTFEMLINAVNMSEEFNKDNITIFAPSNDAWNKLPNEILTYFKEDETGQDKLRSILRNHIFPGYVDVTDLIQKPSLQSLQGVALAVYVTASGQIVLNRKANITQVDIPCKGNVYYYHTDGILVPDYMEPIVKSECPVEYNTRVKGPCIDNCQGVCALSTDTASPGEMTPCMTFFKKRSCEQICFRKRQLNQCCQGFYGPQCLPCPGGIYKPCNGNGNCDDLLHGAGKCSCKPGFTGLACEKCSLVGMFGPNCNQTCTCLKGICDDGPNGTGRCKKNSCFTDHEGPNCDSKMIFCGPVPMYCHTHAQCSMNKKGIASCQCLVGYEGDGTFICAEVNPCLKDNGGCHAEAKCTKLGPGTSRCECNSGWTGDGFSCSPLVACLSHTDCHVNAKCHDLELGKYYCTCNIGYKGNGSHCELVNPCVVNNGGCHPDAFCTPLMFGVRNCSCQEPLVGDGFTCYGTIAYQVMSHQNLTLLSKYLQLTSLYSVFDDQTEKLTLFAPSDTALAQYLSLDVKTNKSYLENDKNSLEFFRFHTLPDVKSVQVLKSMAGIYKTYETLYDGFFLRIINDNQSLHIMANHSSFAVILQPDIPAVNGLIHVVDKVLEPFIPNAEPPTLDYVLWSQPELKLFSEALKSTSLLDMMKDLDELTVFAPIDSAMQFMNASNMAQHLKYYIVPKYVFTPTLETGDTVDSLLGYKYPLEFSLKNDQVQVNNVTLIKTDILFDGGVLHIIEGLIHPVLHHCNNVTVSIAQSTCEPCSSYENTSVCPVGFTPVTPTIKNTCAMNSTDILGCQVLCERNETVFQCCSGYYGPNCNECPGGSETPCNGYGVCSDGITGDGQCSCDIGYIGQDCRQCLQTNRTPPFCTDAAANCSYMNGNCSLNAECTITKSGASCRCRKGYIGDGSRCSSPCETLLVGGCHQQAQCLFNETTQAVQCVCNKGFLGNGTTCSRNENPCDKENGGCDHDRARCSYNENTDDVDCKCFDGYVGNGSFCSQDLMDAVSRLASLSYFKDWLDAQPSSTIAKVNLTSKQNQEKVTLFAPISKNWETLDLLDLVINQYIWLSTDQVSENNIRVVNKNMSFLSSAGNIINVTVTDKGQYFVNDISVIESNIEALNGVIHLTAEPIVEFVKLQVASSRMKSTSMSVIIVVTIAVVVIVALIAVVGLVIHRKKYEGIFKLFKRSSGTGSESNLSFARLSAQEEDNDSFKDMDASKYENPIFNDTEVL